jgi:hypothetical protein
MRRLVEVVEGAEEMGKSRKQKRPPMTADLAELARLQDELEGVLLTRLGDFIKEHPAADSARFAVTVFLALAGRIGLSHLGAESTAECMEITAAKVREHGKKSPAVH